MDSWYFLFYLERKKNKFKEMVMQQYTMKVNPKNVEVRTPVKSIFRTFNPERTPQELLEIALR